MPRAKGPIRKLETQFRGINVRTIRGIDIGIEADREMVTGDERMIIRRRVVCMFHRGTMILNLELNHCYLS